MTKEVFVWKGHGDICVYACDTPEQLELLLDTVYDVVCQIVEDDKHAFLEKMYERNKDCKPKALIRRLIEEAGEDCDSFEYGTGFTELKV